MRKNDAVFVISMIVVIVFTVFALFSPVYIDDYGYEMTMYSAQGFSSIILIFTEFNILLQVSLRLKDDDFEVKNRFMKWGYPSLFVISSLTKLLTLWTPSSFRLRFRNAWITHESHLHQVGVFLLMFVHKTSRNHS